MFNSKLFWYFIQKTGYVFRGGYFTFKTNYVSPFPVPTNIEESDHLQIHKLVQEILLEKENAGSDTNELEKQVNKILYKVYDLTAEDIYEIEKTIN